MGVYLREVFVDTVRRRVVGLVVMDMDEVHLWDAASSLKAWCSKCSKSKQARPKYSVRLKKKDQLLRINSDS